MGKRCHLCFLFVCWYSCHSQTNPLIVTGASGKNDSVQVIQLDSTSILNALHKIASGNDKKYLTEFYRQRSFNAVWLSTDSGFLLNELYNSILHIDEEGIMVDFKEWPTFVRLMHTVSRFSTQEKAELEIIASVLFIHYGQACWNGVATGYMHATGWNKTAKNISTSELLNLLTLSKNIFNDPPVFFQYQSLKKALKHYRHIQQDGPLPVLIYPSKKPLLGDSSAEIKKIVQYFRRIKIYPVDAAESWNAELIDCIKKQQVQFGLKPDGQLSRELIRMLNVPIHDRISQIIVNMERCRWIRNDSTPVHLVVNIPDFNYYLMLNNRRAWIRKLIVGKEYQPTAIFNGLIQYIVICPYWNIPPGILNNEILPQVRRNPSFLFKNDMEWYGRGIRQRPGLTNPLGRIKFLFPNSFNMYMHDTPGKYLFSQRKRTFSHGCMRIENAVELAAFLLKDQTGWTQDELMKAIERGREIYVSLVKAIPIHITYLTCWADESTMMQFRDDVYRYDQQLFKMAKGRFCDK